MGPSLHCKGNCLGYDKYKQYITLFLTPAGFLHALRPVPLKLPDQFQFFYIIPYSAGQMVLQYTVHEVTEDSSLIQDWLLGMQGII